MNKITSVIPTYNNLPFLQLTVKSVRKNCYYKDMPLVIFAENCTDGTDEWLEENADELGIEFYIEKANHVSLIIYDLKGNQVKRLIDKFLESDSYKISWDGKDDKYINSPSGIYIASMTIDGIISNKKLTLIK